MQMQFMVKRDPDQERKPPKGTALFIPGLLIGAAFGAMATAALWYFGPI